MGYVTPEQISRAKEIDLLTYLQSCEPDNLVHFSGNTYCTREHDSLKISNGKWNWFSRGVGGKTALDYLIKVQGCSFTQAVETLVGQNFLPMQHSPQVKQKEQKPRELCLPQPSRCGTQIVSYLYRRGIDDDIIDYCIRTGRLYESQPYHNVVFVGYDLNRQPRYAALRSTVGDFKGEAAGSDKRFAFSIAEKRDSACVHLFEAAIDLLSYATLMKLGGREWKTDALLSLGGVTDSKQSDELPKALRQYLQDHPKTKTIRLHLDNDEAGRRAAESIMRALEGKYEVLNQPPPKGKDVNEFLQRRLGVYRQKEAYVR